MEAKLVIVGGKASNRTVALQLPTIIGRSRDAGVTIVHPMISRQHCELFEADGLLMVRDLGSMNGTVVNGRQIEESPLPPEAEFSIGPLTFRAQYKYEGDLRRLPAPRLVEQRATDETVGDPPEMPDFEEIDETTPPGH